ncbi:DMT family transporter [Ovoidimarina sediminis]|uniref:DMT family transporter n=1 Tax=Ovoidimarina sediminis TaxID=3079856 RepID=UPI002911E9BC|nr:DMT family transporter [Rhodophyticola sp. MJ-SS7]MDU8943325.1 DMT family transporter [Rhodophyticola sp. MJ-SS7]
MSETRPIAAALFVIAAMGVIGFIDNYVVVIAGETGLWQFHLMRAAIALPLLAAAAALGFGTLRATAPRPVALRSFLVSATMVLYFGTLAFLPIAKVVAGLFTAPLWVMVISALFLGQRVGPVRALAGIVGFLGVLLVLKPEAGSFTPVSAVPLVAGLLYALGAIVTREGCARESVPALLTGFFTAMAIWSILGLLVLAILQPDAPPGAAGFILRGWGPPSETALFWTAVQAVGSILGVGLLTRGYQLADASFVAVFEYSLLGFVSVWAWVLRGETLDALSLAGLCLIAVSGVVIALRGRDR